MILNLQNPNTMQVFNCNVFAKNGILVSYSDGISDYFDEFIYMRDFHDWAEKRNRLEIKIPVHYKGVRVDTHVIEITFQEYMTDLDWKEVELYLESTRVLV